MIAERSPRPGTGPRAALGRYAMVSTGGGALASGSSKALTDNCGGNRPDRRVVAAQKASAKNGSGPLAQW
jgi:hypothetical protein